MIKSHTRKHAVHPAFQHGSFHIKAAKQSLGSTDIQPSPAPFTFHAKHHLDPAPDAYSLTPFTDRCSITVHSGAGGHGCVAFLREKFIEDGPANGGDGGDGGSVYIQAARGETSLHRLARRRVAKAGRGGSGRGKGKAGERGADLLLTVPVGTVVRETHRYDPRTSEGPGVAHRDDETSTSAGSQWIAYPGLTPSERQHIDVPDLPEVRVTRAQAAQPPEPIQLDLEIPTEKPTLLAAGACGGLGNPHFVTKESSRPKYATRGESGMTILLELELKMLADVGLVGLPNAGKSTLLRALSNSRTRVGDWEFTTLQPSIGTVILDDHIGRPSVRAFDQSGKLKTNFTIADIPGLIEDAHLDKGLGLGFLRHIERARILAFVVDLSRGGVVDALKALWREVGEYETIRNQEINAETERRISVERLETRGCPLPTMAPPITSKPWLVLATKADRPGTEQAFESLKEYVSQVRDGSENHPSQQRNAWKKRPFVIPISAIRNEGVERIPGRIIELLE